ncbi:MAG: thioesterase II family protein [Vicinamibacterales bacterium]
MTSPWIAHRVQKPAARVRLLCFPHAGAGASVFRPWTRAADETLDVCPVQLPGRETRWGEPPIDRVEPLVDALCDAVAPCIEDRYALFGCSMGAVVAFELARALRRRSLPSPSHLFVAARRAPTRLDRRAPIHHLSDAELVRRIGAYAGTPAEILASADVMSLYLPAIRADFTLCETYVCQPGPLLDCPVNVFGGHLDSEVTPDDLAAWRDVTVSSCRVQMFDEGHLFLHSQQSVLLDTIASELWRTDATPERVAVA